jgi:glucosyl-3-phosphoglycerate synthase
MTAAVLAALRHFRHQEFSAEALASAKATATGSVCLPARDEAATIGPIVSSIRASLAGKTHLVDEIVVVDDRSSDVTATVTATCGARVVPVATPSGSRSGKGAAMATALAESRGDLVVFLDADVERFSPHFVVGLLGPLLVDRAIGFVTATYLRPFAGTQRWGRPGDRACRQASPGAVAPRSRLLHTAARRRDHLAGCCDQAVTEVV